MNPPSDPEHPAPLPSPEESGPLEAGETLPSGEEPYALPEENGYAASYAGEGNALSEPTGDDTPQPEPGYAASYASEGYAPSEPTGDETPPPEPGYAAWPEGAYQASAADGSPLSDIEAPLPAELEYSTPFESEQPSDAGAYTLPGAEYFSLPEQEASAVDPSEDAGFPETYYTTATDYRAVETGAEAEVAPVNFAPAEVLVPEQAAPSEPGLPPPPSTSDAEVALLCEGLERFLGGDEARVHVLRGVSLRLEPGYVHAVVGPSGCGKSSLLYILGLLDRPDAGRLVISGQPVANLTDDELSQQRNALLGFIFQFHFLLQDFTAQENVMIPMRQLGVLGEAEMRDRARHLLDAVGLAEKGHRPSRHLSGGEQQRVAIARALANDPQVILADEPTGNLDTANSTRVFSLLTDLVHRENKALLLVTHNPGIAEACDWVHTMRDGLIVDQQYVGKGG